MSFWIRESFRSTLLKFREALFGRARASRSAVFAEIELLLRRSGTLSPYLCLVATFLWSSLPASSAELERLQYNHPGLVVDLGVGLWAWPMPMDFDSDGDYDLVVVCPDKPFNGTYFFENTMGDRKLPLFEPPLRISKGMQNVQVSYVEGKPRVLSPGVEYIDFFNRGLEVQKPLGIGANEFYQTEGRILAPILYRPHSDFRQET